MYNQLLRNRSFMALWIGQLISFIGDYFNYLAIPITINQLTGSPAMVGLSFISNALPSLLLGPVAGVFVDRWDRRKVMIASDVLRGLLVLLLLLVHDASQVWIFYVVGFCISCTSQFFFPARGAVLPLIVTDREDWLKANGMMQIIQTVGLIAGPTLAGFAIGELGTQAAFVANSLGYFCSAVAVIAISVQRTTPGSEGGMTFHKVWDDLHEGLVYLFNNRSMVGVLICLSVAFLGIGAINVIWVPYLQGTFGVGAQGLGIVDTAQGIGMVISGLLLGVLAARVTKVVMCAIGMIAIGIFFGLMGYTPVFEIIIALSFLAGLALTPVQSALATIMQLAVPDLKRGRVGSSMNAIQTAGSLVSMALASFFGQQIGLSNVFLLIGIFLSGSGVLAFWLLKEPSAPTVEPVLPH
jgi:MFS transporter, DHA3 family, macrolide efflux protein